MRAVREQDLADRVLNEQRRANEKVAARLQLEVQRVANVRQGDAARLACGPSGNLEPRRVIP